RVRRGAAPERARLPFRPGRRGIHQRPQGSRPAGDRCRRQIHRHAEPDRSAGSDEAARRDDPGQRARAERPHRHRERHPADPAATLSRNLPAGRYRWEASDPATGAQSSLRFHVGWWVEGALPDVPDKLEAALDKQSYQPGETAKLFVKAAFAGEAELAIASDRILTLRSISLPAGGTTVEVPVDAAWGTGVYALVSAYRPQAAAAPGPGPTAPRGPGRAVGVAWLGIDASPRTLSVALAAPDVSRPRGPAGIGVQIAGLAANEAAYVTLAAVDEAVLKLTEFDSPTPEKYYFGKRRLGVEWRDLYGRLIDTNAN